MIPQHHTPQRERHHWYSDRDPPCLAPGKTIIDPVFNAILASKGEVRRIEHLYDTI